LAQIKALLGPSYKPLKKLTVEFATGVSSPREYISKAAVLFPGGPAAGDFARLMPNLVESADDGVRGQEALAYLVSVCPAASKSTVEEDAGDGGFDAAEQEEGEVRYREYAYSSATTSTVPVAPAVLPFASGDDDHDESPPPVPTVAHFPGLASATFQKPAVAKNRKASAPKPPPAEAKAKLAQIKALLGPSYKPLKKLTVEFATGVSSPREYISKAAVLFPGGPAAGDFARLMPNLVESADDGVRGQEALAYLVSVCPAASKSTVEEDAGDGGFDAAEQQEEQQEDVAVGGVRYREYRTFSATSAPVAPAVIPVATGNGDYDSPPSVPAAVPAGAQFPSASETWQKPSAALKVRTAPVPQDAKAMLSELKALLGPSYKPLKKLTMAFAIGSAGPRDYINKASALFPDGAGGEDFARYMPGLVESADAGIRGQQATTYLASVLLSEEDCGDNDADEAGWKNVTRGQRSGSQGSGGAPAPSRSNNAVGGWSALPASVTDVVPEAPRVRGYVPPPPPPARPFRAKAAPSAWSTSAGPPTAVKTALGAPRMPPASMLKQEIGTATKGMAKLRADEKKAATAARDGKQKSNNKGDKEDLRNLAFGK